MHQGIHITVLNKWKYIRLNTIVFFFFEQVKALNNEISILKKLTHERIVSYYGSEQKDGHLHLFMDFMAGVRTYMWCGFRVPQSKRNGYFR